MDIYKKISDGISKGHSLLEYIGDLSKIQIEDVEYDTKTYRRKVIYIDDDIEIIVIGWDKGQSSAIHDHPENGCIYRIIEGEMVERLYNKDIVEEQTKILKKGEIGNMMDNQRYHKMENRTNERASSIHIYSPPNYRMNIYNK